MQSIKINDVRTERCGSMYRGFSLDVDEASINKLIPEYRWHLYNPKFVNSDRTQNIWDALTENIVLEHSIDVDKLQSDWFPTIKSDVFLSHSHKDIELAKKISYLLNKIKLSTFIDSEVWGYSDDLVKQIKEKYYGHVDSLTHNRIVAHVNIMLASALTKMMNNTECVIFLNTPNSIIPDKYSDSKKTTSPWIYHELFISSVLPVNPPLRKSRPHSVVNEATQILYTPPLEHLTDLVDSDFNRWIDEVERNSFYHSLDVLYALKPLN